MDDLFYASLEQIALQGPPGCPLGKLFALIERAPAAAGHPLSDVVKEALWGMLLHAEPDVTFVIPREGGAPEGHMAGSKPKKGKKAKKGEDDSEGDDEAADTERAGAVIHAKTLQPGASSELGSLQAAQQHGVHVVASRELQDDAIGLYDVKLTKHQLSNLQRKALGLVGAAGYAGILQNELCNSLGQDPRSFFYVIKNLEQRGLLVKRAAMVQGANVSHVNKGKVQTNLLHLARFAPALDRDMKYTDGTAIGHRSTMLALDSGSQPLGSGVLGMLDDAAHFRRICERLAGLQGRCARETEFKTVLGYQGTWGHRIWRRLKATLVKRGHLEEFVATVEARPVKVIRLLKGFAEDHSDNEESGEDEEGEGGAGAEGRGLLSSQVAELTIDRQLFRSILAAGPDGVTSLELDSRLAFNLKRGMLRLRELEKRFDVMAQMVNQGRSAMIRYTASEGLLATYGQDVAPLNPPGGWLGLVETAIEQGLEPGDPFPNLGMMAGVAQQPSALPLQAEAAVDAAVRPRPMEVVEDGVSAEAGAAQDAAEVPAPPVENGGPEPSLQQRAPMFIVSEPAPRPPSAASGGPDAGGGQGVFARQATLLFQKRVHWLIERVEQDGFVLQSALPRFFKECDEAEGVHNSSKPDRKTIARVVERAEATGRVQSLQVALPTVQGGLQTRSHTIVVKPGIETGPEFVDKVYHAHRTLSQRIRRDATGLAQKLHMSGIPIPQLQLPSLLPSRLAAQQQGTAGDENPEAAAAADNTSEHAAARVAAEPAAGYVDLRAQETHRRMSANGFVSAKLQRVKLLHQVALRAVGLAAGPRLKQQLHDEGPQPEVAEGQHEQQQQQKQQQEEEGLQQEQQETDVAPAMAASAELLAGPAQDASGPTAQAQAAAATAAGAADFLVSAVAGEGMAPSRLDVQTMAADDPRRRYLLTSQGLWDCLTVEQYVQIVGTSTDDTDAVRQLVATGKRLGGLTPEEQQQLFGLEPLYAHRPTQRLSSLLDLMMRMGLLSSVVPVGPRARFGLHGLEANTFVVRERVQFQEPGPRQLLGPLETGVQAGGQQPLRLTHSFDLSAHEGFLMYWARLQYAVVGSNRQGARLPLADPLRQCFPFDRATEVAFEKSWSTRRTMSTQQWAQLQAAVAHVRDPYLITAQACFDLARTLGIEYENVLAFVREQRSRTRKERLGGATLGLGRIAGIGARGKGLGGAAGLGGGRGRGGGGVARAPVTEAQAEARRKAAEGRHRRKLEALQRQHRAEGLAESALPMELPPRPTKRRPPSQGLLRVRPEADTHREKAERLALAQHAAAGTQGRAAAAAAAATAAAAAAVRDSRGTQRAAQRQLLPPNSESEEEEGELEPVEVDREALMTKPPPMRKKKWHPYEDRQLLCAWAGFLARQGPDKMLIWRKLRGRPTPFKAATLRNRMRELRKQEDTAPLVARIQEAAVSVYERSVEHEAEQLRKARQAAAAAAAAAEASLDKVELPPLPPSWPSSSQLGKRPAEEAAAAATLAGSGGGHQEGQAEQAGTGASDSMDVAAQEREEGELPASVAAKRLRQLAPEPLSGLEEAEEAMKLLDSLAPARDIEDRRALQEIALLVERVVSLAPKRFSAQLQLPLQPLTAPRPVRPAVVYGKASSGKRPGPKPGFRQLRSEVARLAGKVHAARPALRLGLAGGRELNLPPSMRPSPTIAALAELLKSLLLMGSEKGTLGPGPQRALLQRFSQEQLMEAFALMHRLGLINPGGGRSSAMQLSDRFRAGLQALGMPSDVFKQAAASKARLREEGRLDVLPAQPTPPGAASIPPATDGLDGGTVAAALDLLLHGQANLEPHGATASPQQPALPAPTLLEARQADLRQHGSLLAISIPVRITCEAQATSDQHPDVQPAQAMAGLREAAAQPNPAQVFYQPSLVAVSQAVRSGAEAAAAAALEAIVSPGSRPEVLLSAVLQAVRETGSEGLAEQDLERLATEQLAAGPSPAGEPMPERAGTFSRALQQYGLVRRIGRWDIAALVAAEHSQGLVAFPEPPSTEDIAAQDERIAGLLEAAGLPKQGQLQRCLDRPFRPWLDHQGQLNESMWEALVERTISIVMRHPGIPERLLVLELGAVSPFCARELLGLMEEHGVLRSQDISRLGGVSANASSRGGGALFACFKGAAQPQPSMLRCYFLTQESIR